MNRYLVTGVIALILFSGRISPTYAQEGGNTTCPVMLGTAVKEKFYTDYRGERIYFCCRACVKAFKKNPKKYLKHLRHDA